MPRDLCLTGWLLVLALAFTTCTVFVPAEWPAQSFHIAIFLLLAAHTARHGWKQFTWRTVAEKWYLLIPFAGLLQIATSHTVARAQTRLELLHWGALIAVFHLARCVLERRAARHVFLSAFVCFAISLAVMTVLTLYTSHGRVAWLFDSGLPEIAGTFQNRNNYAQFVELAIPVAVWGALRDRRRAWSYTVGAAALYASVIGTASRAGSILCTAEIATMFGMTFVRSGRWARVPLFVVPAAAALFALIMGWERVWPRFFEPDPFAGRREYLQAAVNMIRARPFTGFGLGAYEIASNAFAVKNSPFYPDHFHPNHVHNDWLELAADGGIPFAAGVLALFVARIRAMFSRTWALGIFAVMLHALVDYPFPRAAVSGWMFALLGAVYAESDEANLQSTT